MLSIVVRIFVLIIPIILVSSQTHIAFGLFEGLFGPPQPCLSKKDTVSKNGFVTYDNKDHNVQIQYPSDWTKDEQNFKAGSEGSALYSLATFQPNTAEGFKSALELEINEISKYTADTKSLTGLGEFEKEGIMLSPEASILSSNEIKINNCPAYQIIYLQGIPNSQEKWKIILTFLIDCDKEYVMRYTGTDLNLYDKYLKTIGDMIQTFHLSKC